MKMLFLLIKEVNFKFLLLLQGFKPDKIYYSLMKGAHPLCMGWEILSHLIRFLYDLYPAHIHPLNIRHMGK